MTGTLDTVLSLAHTPGGVMIAVLMFATAAGFVAGLLFERSAGRRSRSDRK